MNEESILTEINQQLINLNSRQQHYKIPSVPDHICAQMSGKRILLVDDSLEWIEFWLPKLILASGNTAQAIHHLNSMPAEELCLQISERKPQFILLDYCLAGRIKGKDIIPGILKILPNAEILGFSSIEMNNRKLVEAGAKAAFDKAALDSNYVLSEIAQYIVGA